MPQQQNKALDHVAAAWAELQTYKTDGAANRDDTHLLRASAHASRGVEAWSTSEALGMRALVFGWEQGWQLRAGRWDPVAHGSLQVAIDQADAEGVSAEAAAARVWLELGACRFHPDPGDRSAACVRLGRAADQAVPLLAARPWMAVEVDWVASLGARSLAEDNLASGRALKIPYTRDTLRRCERGLASVDAARINGRYLWQNCVRLAGWAEDVPRFLRWGDAMVQLGRARRYTDEELLPALFVGAAPACTKANITTRKGRPTTWDGRVTGG